jgi:hypothetical protein
MRACFSTSLQQSLPTLRPVTASSGTSDRSFQSAHWSRRGTATAGSAARRNIHGNLAHVIVRLDVLAYRTDAAKVLFHVVNERHRRHRPMIFTTNKSLKAWGRVLHDDDLAQAITDRVLERGRLLRLDGPSVRMLHVNLDDAMKEESDQEADLFRISGTHSNCIGRTAAHCDCRFANVRSSCSSTWIPATSSISSNGTIPSALGKTGSGLPESGRFEKTSTITNAESDIVHLHRQPKYPSPAIARRHRLSAPPPMPGLRHSPSEWQRQQFRDRCGPHQGR